MIWTSWISGTVTLADHQQFGGLIAETRSQGVILSPERKTLERGLGR